MNELKFLLILIAVSLFACQNENVLTKVDEKQKLEIFRYSQYPPKDSVVFKNHLGEVMNKDTLNDYEKKGYFFDFYKNENGKIVEVVYHQKSKEDEIFLEKLANYDDGLRKVPVLEINCDEGKELLERLMEADQKNREGSIDSNIDIVIQDSLFNYINQCGLPSIEKVGKRGIFAMFLIIQHSESIVR